MLNAALFAASYCGLVNLTPRECYHCNDELLNAWIYSNIRAELVNSSHFNSRVLIELGRRQLKLIWIPKVPASREVWGYIPQKIAILHILLQIFPQKFNFGTGLNAKNITN